MSNNTLDYRQSVLLNNLTDSILQAGLYLWKGSHPNDKGFPKSGYDEGEVARIIANFLESTPIYNLP